MPNAKSQIRTEVPVSLFFGDSYVLKQRAGEEVITAKLSPEERSLAFTRIHGDEVDPDRLLEEATCVSLLAPQRVILVEEAGDLDEEAQSKLIKILPSLAPGLTLIFLANVDKNRRPSLPKQLLQAIRKVGQVVNCSVGHQRQIPRLLAAEAQNLGKRMDRRAAEGLAELVGGEFDLACRELEKIALFVGEQEDITLEDVTAMTAASPEANQFRLADAVGEREAPNALKLLEDFLPPESRHGAGIPLLGIISRQLRLLFQAKALEQARGQAETLNDRFPERHNYFAAVSGRDWLERKLAAQAAKWHEREIAWGLVRVYETDRRLKGLTDEQIDDRIALELLIAELCR